ncbi:DMT family transporter [uncultured Sulfitobacter sp.]|uniref:DMT family transporter n=1 Tax=uncultured Sulfitobacter sp. TaxID=191468 RepID=UPI002622944E|nr:DMT family transporter [uncultured Sulfitobacter sp.]
MMPDDNPRLGIILRVLSGVLFAGMVICVKAVSENIPLGEIVFFRSAFAIIPLIIFLWLRGEFPQGLATKRPFDHMLRASLGTLALFASFASIARLNIAEAVLIAQLSPIFMAIAAALLLRERLTVWRIGGLVCGFAGVVVMVWPEIATNRAQDARLFGFVLALLSAILGALALIMVRRLNRTESPGSIALYFVLASMLGALFTLPSGWVMPNGWALILLIGAGLFGGFAHIAMTLAFRYAEATRLAPFEYLALLWPLLADLLIFRLPLTTSFMLAAPLVLFGAAVAAAEQSKRVGDKAA